jgi:hypothetical protein
MKSFPGAANNPIKESQKKKRVIVTRNWGRKKKCWLQGTEMATQIKVVTTHFPFAFRSLNVLGSLPSDSTRKSGLWKAWPRIGP